MKAKLHAQRLTAADEGGRQLHHIGHVQRQVIQGGHQAQEALGHLVGRNDLRGAGERTRGWLVCVVWSARVGAVEDCNGRQGSSLQPLASSWQQPCQPPAFFTPLHAFHSTQHENTKKHSRSNALARARRQASKSMVNFYIAAHLATDNSSALATSKRQAKTDTKVNNRDFKVYIRSAPRHTRRTAARWPSPARARCGPSPWSATF